jgi:hypothetical protein
MGGLNVTNKGLAQFDPLKTGFTRIFFIKMPVFLGAILPVDAVRKVKHILEYGFMSIDGLQNLTLDFEQVTGGFAGRTFEVPTVAKDDTNEITIRVPEFTGSPMREYIDMWITGIADKNSGIGTYHGAMDEDDSITYSQVNHTAEAILVSTDPTLSKNGIEYCCLLSNMIPKTSRLDHFNTEAGSHPLVTLDIPFTTTKFESKQINTIGKALMEKYNILSDYLEFDSGYTLDNIAAMETISIDGWPSESNT